MRGLTLPRPNRKMPMNTDSAKKAKTPSIASVWPITPPLNAENRAQFVPNWNSSGMPVTTPTANVTAKTLARNRAAAWRLSRWLSSSRSIRKRWFSRPKYATVLNQAMKSASPIVRIGNR